MRRSAVSPGRLTGGMESPRCARLAPWKKPLWKESIELSAIPHIPVIRRGKPYESLDKANVINHRNGEILATVSQVNAGVIRKDLARVAESRAALKKFSVAQLIEKCAV